MGAISQCKHLRLDDHSSIGANAFMQAIIAKSSSKTRKTGKEVSLKRKPHARSASKLAIDGGPKAVTNKLQGWPQFDENAIRSVEQVLRSGKVNYWTGKRGVEFEKRFAE